MNLTLNKIKKQKPCKGSWEILLKSMEKTKADETVVSCEYLLKILGIRDTLWVIYNCVDGEFVKKSSMVADIAERVLHVWEDWAKDNLREHLDAPKKAIKLLRDPSIRDQLDAAVNASAAASSSASSASSAAASYAAAASSSASSAAYAAASYAAAAASSASSAAYAVYATYAADDAAYADDADAASASAASSAAYAADDAAYAAPSSFNETKAQKEIILKYWK